MRVVYLSLISTFSKEIEKIASRIPSLCATATAMLAKLKQYYEAATKKTVYSIAAVLDPRINIHFFRNHPNYKTIRQQFKLEAAKFEIRQEEATAVSCNEDDEWMETIYKKRRISNLEAEIKNYFQEELLDRHAHPYDFWKLKSTTYPTLSAMAKTYLAVPSTSTPSERAFSLGRLIVHHTRASLSVEKIRALMCLNSWFSNKSI